MGSMEDGWKRIIRQLAERVQSLGYASLRSNVEDLGTQAQDVWVSPSDVVLFADLPPKDFTYGGGSLTYTGSRNCRALVSSTMSVSIGGGLSGTAEITNGKNGVPCTFGIMPNSSSFGGEILLDTTCAFELEPGDTLDVFVRQTSEAGGTNITVENGVYHIRIQDVF